MMETAMRLAVILTVSLWVHDSQVVEDKSRPQGPAEILRRLRESDASMREGVTVNAKLRCPMSPLPSFETERLVVEATMTMKGDTWALRLDTDKSLPPPKYPTTPDKAVLGGIDGHGDARVSRPVRQSGLREKDFIAMHHSYRSFRLDTAGGVHAQEMAPFVEVFSPSRTFLHGHTIAAYVLVLSSGRGFSDLIDEITEVSESPDGQLHCKATGKYMGGWPCAWELSVAPEHQYLVTSAKSRRGAELVAEMRNQGIQNFAGGLLPGQATYALFPRTQGVCTGVCYETTFLGMTDSADLELISHNRTLLPREFEKGTEVIDFRSGVPEAYTVGEVTATPKAHSHGVGRTGQAPQTPHSRAHIWYLIMAANAFVALLWAVWRYRRAMNAESTP